MKSKKMRKFIPCIHRTVYYQASARTTYYSSVFDCCSGYRSCGYQNCCRKKYSYLYTIYINSIVHDTISYVHFCVINNVHMVQLLQITYLMSSTMSLEVNSRTPGLSSNHMTLFMKVPCLNMNCSY